MTNDIYCDAYNDPTADIVLKSNEGMLFRIHSYYLKAHSSVFRDMFASTHLIHNPNPDAGVKPIEVDASSDVLYDFLDLISKASVLDFLVEEPHYAIFDLCDTFDCQIVIQRLIHILNVKAYLNEAWGTFRIAARYNNLPLARHAISMMDYGHNPWGGSLCWSDIGAERAKEIAPEYLVGLLNVLNNPRNRRDFDKMAQEFTPAT